MFFEIEFAEDSCHQIEIVATDNVEKQTVHRQCVFVDNKAPEPVKQAPSVKVEFNAETQAFKPGFVEQKDYKEVLDELAQVGGSGKEGRDTRRSGSETQRPSSRSYACSCSCAYTEQYGSPR